MAQGRATGERQVRIGHGRAGWRTGCLSARWAEDDAMEILGAGGENAKGWLGLVEVAVNVKSPRRSERGKASGQGPDHCGGWGAEPVARAQRPETAAGCGMTG